MYPAAGIIIWIFLGALIGLITGKITRTDTVNGTMANTGVGAVSAVFAGFATTVAFNGEKSDRGFWLAIVVAAGTAILAIALFRTIYRGRVATLR